jgi:hypothetical protein
MALFELGSTSVPARRIGWGAGGAFVAASLLWFALYASGVFPWLGYSWLKRDSFGAGPFGVIGENQAGTTFGLSTLLFFKGQEIVVDYDAEIRAGSLWFYVYDMTKIGQGGGASHYVTQSGTGVWTYAVPQTGFYKIAIGPSVVQGAGRGYDLSYSVWWGARPAS